MTFVHIHIRLPYTIKYWLFIIMVTTECCFQLVLIMVVSIITRVLWCSQKKTNLQSITLLYHGFQTCHDSFIVTAPFDQ